MGDSSNLGRRNWEQGVVGGPDRLNLIESLCHCGMKSQPVYFRSHARVLPIQIESLKRKPGNDTGMEFELTGTMETEDLTYWVEGWYNVETGMGHLILRTIFDNAVKQVFDRIAQRSSLDKQISKQRNKRNK